MKTSPSSACKLVCRTCLLVFIVLAMVSTRSAQGFTGATIPWTTYEAENMTISGGQILGPPQPVVDNNAEATNTAAMEASGRQCVQLNAVGQYVQFAAQSAANALVVRYSVPDTASGSGANYTLSLYLNGTFLQEVPMTSVYSWLYGGYPFENTPSEGTPRNFFDEARVSGLTINPGDLIRLQVGSSDTATNYDIDLVDLENVAPALTAPPGSVSVKTYGATGNGVTDDTVAISNCVAAGGIVWVPPGNYLVSGDIDVPAGTTIQGAGMWYTTFVGDPTKYSNQYQRVRFNGEGNNIHLADFAIIGKLNYRDDSEENDGLANMYGTGSTISRIWVEHTKVGAWLYNSSGLVVDSCRFRDTIADGININGGMQGTTVTNCTTRGTGDDCFAMWPAVISPQLYVPGYNVFTHCTAQVPFFANGGGIYGGASNRIENCLFQDIPYGAGVLINGTYPVSSSNVITGQTVAQNSVLNRCGGYDPGWQWRGALALDAESMILTNVLVYNLTISNSLSYAVKIISRNGDPMSNSLMSNVVISTYGLADPPYHPPVPNQSNYVDGVFGVWAGNGANGNLTISGLTVNGDAITNYPGGQGDDITNQASGFTFIVTDTTIGTTVSTSPAGLSFSVDGTNYTTQQTFYNWAPGSVHTLTTTATQSGGTGTQYVWNSWSDGGAISHTVSPTTGTSYTANFTTQYFLTMNAGTNGSVSPASLWTNSGSLVGISATPAGGFTLNNWAGSGSGSYSGNNNPASITMNGPITETASFALPSKTIALSGNLAFGNVMAGSSSNLTLTIGNTGNTTLTVSSITYPAGFSGGFSGTVPANGSTNVTVTFSPTMATNYSGNLTVNSDATSGGNTLGVSGKGTPSTIAALLFTTQPGSAVAGIPFGRQPVLQTVDAYGNPSTVGLPASLPGQVSLTNGNGTLTGATSFNLGTSFGNGVVAFTNLAISSSGTGDELLATITGAASGSPVAGAVLWLDAADSTTLTTNGTKVVGWRNKGSGGAGASGTNLWFTQYTSTLQPWLTNQLNGKPVLTFSKNGSGYGAGCTYLGNIGHASYTNGGSQMTYFVVARQNEDSMGWQGPVSFSTSGQTDGSGTAGVVVLADGSQTAPYPLGIQRNHAGTPMQADVAAATVNTAFVMAYVDNAGAASLYLTNGSGLSEANTASIINGISPYKYSITDATIGGRLEPDPGTVDNGWDGDVAEVLSYNTALNTADQATVESYLVNKWLTASPPALASALSQPFTVSSSTTISATVTTSPAGLAFSVDGTNYTTQQTFTWVPGSNHSIATTATQSGGTGIQYLWSAWSDGGAISHTVASSNSITYTASFTTQYYLTMNPGTNGSVSPASLWTNSGSVVAISATPAGGFGFNNWTGSGSGSYSGNNNPASITMNGPITETASFAATSKIIALSGNLGFGNVVVGTSSNRTLTIGNTGNTTLTVSSITYPAGFSGGFSGTVPSNGSTNVTVTFSPTVATNYSGNLTVNSDATSGGNTLAVSGTGVAAISKIIALSGNLGFGNVTVGNSSNRTLTIGNTGNTTLTVSSITYPAGFSGGFSGTVPSNGSTNVTVTFIPTVATNYSGNLTVNSDATSGGNTLAVSGTGVAPTNQPPVAGAVLWLDAADSTTLTASGAKVVGWRNKGSGGAGASGTNLWFTQYTATLQPWLTNQLNGKPVLTFSKNGSGYSAGCTYLGNIGHSSYTNAGSQMTYFIVARQNEDSIGWQGPVSFSTSGQTDGSGTAGVVVLADGSQTAPYPLGIQRNHPGTPMQADVAAATVNTAFVMAYVDNAGAASLYLTNASGLSEANTATITNGISPYKYSITDTTIGGRLEPDPGTVDNGWDGDVAEVLVYNTALTAADRTSVESYLVNKWLTNGESGLVLVPANLPPQQNILGLVINGDGSVTLTYATTPGYPYHVESTTNLNPASWTPLDGSATNATEAAASFTDPNPAANDQRYYRSVSP